MLMEKPVMAQPATVPMRLGVVPTMAGERERNPGHLALVLQGHQQWAREHGLSYADALSAGAGRLLELIDLCAMRSIHRMTVCIFSEDLHRRPSNDSEFFGSFMRYVTAAAQNLHRHDVRVRIECSLDRLDSTMRGLLSHVSRRTHMNLGMELVLAIDGFAEAESAQHSDEVVDTTQTANEALPRIDEGPDLVIRTGGPMPLHRSMLWDTRTTALYFTDLDWPAFDAHSLQAALRWYGEAHRSAGIDSPARFLPGELGH